VGEAADGAGGAAPLATVIVPFHRGRPMLERVVAAIARSPIPLEIVVVANGHDEDLAGLAAVDGLRLLDLPAACGPAIARNRGAEAARAPILAFIDADVVPHPAAIPALLDRLHAEPDVVAVFGAYDHEPPHPGFYSQYRNLAHAFVHEQANREARTFWAGLGAVRADAFRAVGGFDERFRRPSIEDIDLGYRLAAAGGRLRVDVAARGTHLRGWTFRSSLVTDVRDRGVPWMQALLKYGAIANDLNVSRSGRVSVVCACAAVAGAVAGLWWPPAIAVTIVALAGFAAAHRALLRWFAARRGRAFALRVLAAQLPHHLCNGVSLAAGTLLWTAQRWLGVRTRWTIAPDRWTPASAAGARSATSTR
jgi:GT2 family glycosyltransferase